MRRNLGPSKCCIEKEDGVLFLSILTFDAANRESIVEKLARGREKMPQGVQVRMELVDLAKNRVFRITEVTDPKAILAANMDWFEKGQIETNLVMESEDLLEALDRIKMRRQRREIYEPEVAFVP